MQRARVGGRVVPWNAHSLLGFTAFLAGDPSRPSVIKVLIAARLGDANAPFFPLSADLIRIRTPLTHRLAPQFLTALVASPDTRKLCGLSTKGPLSFASKSRLNKALLKVGAYLRKPRCEPGRSSAISPAS